MNRRVEEHPVRVPVGEGLVLEGDLTLPEEALGVVLFAHGSGSSRFSSRNRFVAHSLVSMGLGTLLIDLLTADEEEAERWTRHLRFDIGLLAQRLVGATDWLVRDERTQALSIGYFGSSTGAAAALVAATRVPDRIRAVVSRGGRPDLAGEALFLVLAPTLLIVGGDDFPVVEMNRDAYRLLQTEKRLEIVPGATHLFEEPGTLEQVAKLAGRWFVRHLPVGARRGAEATGQNP
ncbi:dienelactone hydrolase family protein [Melittangium boletus]|uniref:DeoR family transcriptional regulator n=1 Tax=Melittangium boletus DSM 14713 TaxID=1294270 RepID=A0A250IF87_9BACT|nr:dienelactone hydrolase family protein [Melittangium boletus]ATB29817.1 DeoR family transcriptional regulator [Melittangium boletus DSM 14713]